MLSTRLGGLLQPLGVYRAPQGETRPVRLTNRLRNLAAGARSATLFWATTSRRELPPDERRGREASALTLAWPRCCNSGCRRKPMIPCAGSAGGGAGAPAVPRPEASARLAAGRDAVTFRGPGTQALLIPTDAQHEPDAAVREAASDSLQKIKHRLLLGDLLGRLCLYGAVAGPGAAAGRAGLAIMACWGDNMAHGEMLMIGAYSCWLVQQALAQLAPQWLAFYPLGRAAGGVW